MKKGNEDKVLVLVVVLMVLMVVLQLGSLRVLYNISENLKDDGLGRDVGLSPSESAACEMECYDVIGDSDECVDVCRAYGLESNINMIGVFFL